VRRANEQDFHEFVVAALLKTWSAWPRVRGRQPECVRPPSHGQCGGQGQPPPRGCNAIGMVVDGSVLSAPRVMDPGGIRGGQTEIAGGSTQQEAQLLAAQAGAAPLPTGFTPNTG
jgi:hypothetical protein